MRCTACLGGFLKAHTCHSVLVDEEELAHSAGRELEWRRAFHAGEGGMEPSDTEPCVVGDKSVCCGVSQGG